MADFAAETRVAADVSFVFGDPVNFAAVLMPFTATEDFVAPVGTAVTVLSTPVHRTDPLIVQIDDTILLKNIIAGVKYAQIPWELAYDGAEFAPLYRSGSLLYKQSSTRWVLTLRRLGGWPYSPTENVRAIDGAGNMS